MQQLRDILPYAKTRLSSRFVKAPAGTRARLHCISDAIPRSEGPARFNKTGNLPNPPADIEPSFFDAFPLRSNARYFPRVTIPVQSLDVIAIALEMLALIVSAFGAAIMFTGLADIAAAIPFVRPTMLGILFYVLAAHGFGGHGVADRFAYSDAALRSATVWISVVLFLCLMGVLLRARIDVPARWLVAFAVLGCLTLPTMRMASVAGGRWLRRAGAFDRRTAIIGSPGQVRKVAAYLGSHPWLTVSICGLYDDLTATTNSGSSPGFGGGMTELIASIRAGEVDQVVVAIPATQPERLTAVVGALALTPVRVRQAFDIDPFAADPRRIVLLGNLPMIALADRPLTGLSGAFKAFSDKLFGLGLLILMGPLFLCVACAIRADTPGPVFFRQDREGFNNRSFRIWKFRSMHVSDCGHSTVVQARFGDPRVTRIGRFLRRSSIDELPQLINVVLGEMSLVGPRPHAVSTCAGGIPFGDVAGAYPARHRVKPGITGWAQVCGLRGETDTYEKLLRRLDHDLFYCERWSLLFDLRILLLTAFAVPFQRTAY